MLDSLYGNAKLKKIINGFAIKKSFPNSLIISGADGSGKHTVAKYIAMTLGCSYGGTEPCGICRNCMKIAENSSPDIINLGLTDGKKSITIDDIRGVREDAFVAPNDLDCKVYIISNAERMLNAAQNCLLKIFEEPPKNVFFILLCESSSALLPTVRSRAPEIRTEIFSDDELKKYIVGVNRLAAELEQTNPKRLMALVRRSHGCVGRINAFLEGSGDDDEISQRGEKLAILLCSGPYTDFLVKMQEYCKTREDAVGIISVILTALRDVISCKRNREEAELMFFSDRNDALSMGGTVSLRTALDIFKTMDEYLDEIDNMNSNVSSSIIALCAEIRRLKQ